MSKKTPEELAQAIQVFETARVRRRREAKEQGVLPPGVIPAVVSMRQARLALLGMGLLSQVETALAAIPDATQRAAAEIEWEYAVTVDRNSPLVQNLTLALGLDDAALDALFSAAGAIQ